MGHHYFAVKHDLKSNEFKSPDSLEQGKYKPIILDWLSRVYDFGKYEHSFKDQWINLSVYDEVSISFDKRVPEQLALLNALPARIKGAIQSNSLKIVNNDTVYIPISKIVTIDYPTIKSVELFYTDKSKDNDGDPFEDYTYKLHLSDGTILWSLSQDKNEPISMEYSFRWDIQQRAFLKHLMHRKW